MIRKGIFILDKNNLLEDIKDNSELLEDLTGFPQKRITQDKSRRFRKELEDRLEKSIRILKRVGYLNEDNTLSEKSIKMFAAKIIGDFEKELEGFYEYGKYISNRYGDSEEWFLKDFGFGDRYSEINPKLSIRKTIKRRKESFVVEKRKEKKGGHYIVLLDVSGSMYGNKIYEAKKALIVLLYKILENNDKATIILFNDRIIKRFVEVENISDILKDIFRIFPNGSTDIALALIETQKYIRGRDHIILITDALPTYGKNPIDRALAAAKSIRDSGATISVVGIKLNKEGVENAKKIVKIGEGNLLIVKEVKDLSKFVILDYFISRNKNL